MKRLVKWGIDRLCGSLVCCFGCRDWRRLWTVVENHYADRRQGKCFRAFAKRSIFKDQYGIPHIEASNRRDAIVALGWTHASERMWQMEVLRMAAQGRLSEMFGEKTVSSDRFLKTLDLAARRKHPHRCLRQDTRDFLQAYADGVNQWINRKRPGFEPSLPVEFIILGHNPEPWEPWHSVAVIKVMALTLDANMDEEIGRLALAGKGFNPRQIDEIYSSGPRDNPPLLPDLRGIYGFADNGANLAMAKRNR